MSNVLFRQFYREKGIRYPGSLTEKPTFSLTEFPRESIFHVYDDGDGSPDIDTTKPYFAGYPRKIIAECVYQLQEPQGPIRPYAFNFATAVQPWKRNHIQKWQLENDLTIVKMPPDQLGVVNYGYLDKAYLYQATITAKYFAWLNRMSTIYENMDRLASVTGRQQFIIVKIPATLQGRTNLDRYVDKEFTTTIMNIFGVPNIDGFFLLDMWRWLSVDYRDSSLLGKIDPKNYDKINLIIEGVSKKQCLLNLGYLNSWIKGQPNQTEFSSVSQFDHVNVQKLFLALCITLNGVIDTAVAEAAEVPEEPGVTGTEVSATSESAPDQVQGIPIDPSSAVAAHKQVALVDKVSAADMGRTGDVAEELMNSIEEDLLALDRISLLQVKNKGIAPAAVMNRKIAENVDPSVANQVIPEPMLTQDEAKARIFSTATPTSILQKRLAEDAESSLITAAEYRRMLEAAKTFETSEDPYGSGKSRQEASSVKPEDLILTPEDSQMVISDAVPDKTMANSSMNAFNRKYLRNVYKKDVMNAVSRLQSAGVIVKNHEIHQSSTILGTYEHHRLEVKPVDGQPSTISFSLPVIDEDGTFHVAGNKYIARKQRVDCPIRKIAPSIVSLSTYYGKTFIQISPKVVNNSTAWIIKQINLAVVTDNSYITEISLGNVFDNEFKAPFMYNALAAEFESFMVGKHQVFFNHQLRKSKIDPAVLATIEKNSRVFCGISANRKPIVIDNGNRFIEINGDKEQLLGDVFTFLHLDRTSSPVDFSEVRVFSKYVPVGVVLGYYVGFKTLLSALGAEYRIVEPRKNKMLAVGEFPIVFKDKTYVFKSDRRFESLILAGFGDFEKVTKLYDSEMFEHKDVYLNLLMTKGLGALYVRELDMMEHAFVDHISEEILLSMNEPTTFKGLLYRGTELLLTYHHPVSQDRSVMRDRGYERFSGAVYKELTQAIRQFRNKNLIGRSKIDISPYQVWNSILKDNTIKIVEDINPIQNLKESEVITYGGAGGRDKDTMTKPTRSFHESDVGILSESTVDNAGVGTVAYLSANPNIGSVRGLMTDKKVLNPTSMMSTASLVSACSFMDNPKRIMFINTQHSHTIAAEAYKQPYIRTGYEKVIGKRTTKLFCSAAEEDGVVTSVTDKGMIVKYASGREDSIPLGRQYGKAEGTVYPHDIVTRLDAGKKFKRGDILSYNEKFFEPDFLSPNEVNMKVAGFATVAFMEDKSTHEDSCTISPELGAKFKTEVTKVKSYTVRFDQGIQEIVKIGVEVNPRDVLMIIEDGVTTSSGHFSDDSINTLKRLANVAPRAGVSGVIEKIEVYYHGEKRDMSPTLKKLTDRSDGDLAAHYKSTGKPVLTGQVTDEYRVSGTPLEIDQAEIKIYITIKAPTGVGDKVIFGHQMKSTIAEVHPGKIFTEGGTEVDAIFSYRSLAAREVNSATLIGMATVLLDLAAKRALNAYYGEGK